MYGHSRFGCGAPAVSATLSAAPVSVSGIVEGGFDKTKGYARLRLTQAIRRRAGILFGVLLAALAGGCANAPEIGAQGARLVVTMQFAGDVNPLYHYFFLVRNDTTQEDAVGLNGPIPVIEPPYGNGFATSLNPGTQTAGFTDFVVYNLARQVRDGFGVYHVPGGITGVPENGIFDQRGVPEIMVPPSQVNRTMIRFEIGLCRFAADPATCDPNSGANVPRFLQVNIVATTTTPINPTTVDPNKYVDAFGEQRLGSGTFNSFITIDAATARTYQSSQNPGDPSYEPDNDTYPSQTDAGIELVAWNIQVIPR